MQTMTEQELDQWVQAMESLQGWHWRQFRYSEKALQIQWSDGEKFVWTTFSFKPGVPYLFNTAERLHLVKNAQKPLTLFFKTHFQEAPLQSCSRLAEAGRVVEFLLQGKEDFLVLQLSLIPGSVNIMAQRAEKVVYAFKPKKPGPSKGKGPEDRALRTGADFFLVWQKFHHKWEEPPETVDVKKDLKKKRAGLQKMQEHLNKLQSAPWLQVGEWLKTHQSLQEVPEEWRACVDTMESLAWNIEHCFSMAKKNQGKLQGTQERMQQLQVEIARLEKGEVVKPTSKRPAENLFHLAGGKGRTVDLGDARLFVGRSGSENLKLLRKAKPWYLWLHIKDYPGAYGIIERNKGQKLSENSLRQAAQAVVAQSLPKGAQGRFEALYAECRYVRPIKGAKAGQVTYSHEKVVTVKVGE